MPLKRLSIDDVARLPAFSHATLAGDFIYVSGTLGTRPGSLELVADDVDSQTVQVLRNMERILKACGAGLEDVVKVNVFLKDIAAIPEMNAAYISVCGKDGPARITVGRADLALGAAVEMDCVAYRQM